MTATAMTDTHDTSASYEIGYGKPPPAHAIPQGPVREPGRPVAAPAGTARERAAAGGGLSKCRDQENGRMVPVTTLLY